jgi:hypothetical protein
LEVPAEILPQKEGPLLGAGRTEKEALAAHGVVKSDSTLQAIRFV